MNATFLSFLVLSSLYGPYFMAMFLAFNLNQTNSSVFQRKKEFRNLHGDGEEIMQFHVLELKPGRFPDNMEGKQFSDGIGDQCGQ